MIETGKARAAVAQSPLQTLYSALQAKLSGTTLNLYPGAIAAGSGPLASALQLIADLNTGVSITGATLSPWPATKIVVTGTTSAFAGSPFTITATFTLDGDQKTVVMTLALSAPHLTFPNAPWFSVDAPSVSVTSKPLSGSFAGTIAFTDTTKKPPTVTTAAVTASITPPGANTSRKALFSTTFNGAAPSIETIYKYVGGFNLSASLPPPLNALTALQLNGVSFTYDFDAKTLTQFTVDLSTTPAQPWNIIGKLSFTTVDVTFTIAGPTGKRSVSWVASPKVTLGAGTIDATLSYPPFAIGGKLDPASVPPSPNQIALADVITFFLPAGITVPISGAIKAFDMKIVPGSGSAKTTYTIATSVTGDWAIPSASPVFTVTSLGFNIDGTKPKPAGSVKGSITFFAGQPKLTFGLDVSAVYDGVVWTISGKQQPKTTIHVSDIIKSYIGNGWWSSALPDFSIQDFSANVVMGDPGSWLLSATVPTFTLPFDLALSNVTGNFGNTIPGTAFFAQIGGDARWFGVDLSFGFDYAPGKQKYTLTWNQVTASLDNSTGEWIGKIAFTGDETLGGIIETFVSWATGYKYGLAAPWDLLNDISLNGSSLTYNFTQKTVTVTVGVGLDLGFCSIQSIGLTYNTQATGNQSKVKFDLNGTFFWTSDKQLSWDATKPETTKQPPGNGNEYFDLRLLAMGQHVAVKGIQDAKTVQAAIALLAAMPPNSDSDPSSSGQQYLPPVEYDAGSDWLIGTDIGLLKLPDGDPSGASYAFTLQVLFDDPKFYALRIALDGGPAKILGGLDFEIIYRKISDTVGVYQAEITLPTAMRTIQTGIFTIQLPTFGIEVFTNGDFQVDFGFPWNNDFSRSFTVQAIIAGVPLMGSAGFYFGKLSSATTNKVPAVSNGTFNPVIVFGFGAQAGFGKSLSMGPLSASFSLTILGIIEGVIARWNPYQIANQGTTSKSQLDGSYFYSLSGTFGVAGMLSGSIDFAIIKASVNISIIITAQIVFTSYAPIVITVAVSVDVSASLEIDLGIFSITLHFHFSLDVNQTFTIGNPQGSAPWTPIAQQHTGALSEPLHRRLSSLRALDPLLLASNGWNTTPSWGVLAKDPSSPKLPLTAYLTFSLTASGDGATSPAGQQVCYVAMIALDAQTPIAASQPSQSRLFSAALPACIGTADTSFDALAKLVARWTVAAFVQTTGTLTCAQLDATIVTDDALKAIQAYLADSSNPVPIPTGTIETMLGEQVAVTLWGPSDVPAGTAIQGAFFPMPVELSLTTPQYGGQAAYGYTFGGYNTIAAGGVGLLRSYFDQLAVQVEDAKPAATANQAPTSVADFVFSDYFLLMARQMIAALRDGLRDFKYALTGGETPQFIVASVNTPQRTQFTVADLFAANAGVPLTGNKTLSIAGATATVQANDTFASVATTRYAGAFTATALATANVTTVSVLQPMQRVTYNGETAVVDAGDSLTTLAARFKQTPTPTAAQLAADPGIQAQANLLIPFAKLALPPLAHTTPSTGTADTAATIAAAYGVSAASLGAPAADGTPNQNGSIANLFAPTDNRLDLPHLLQHTVGALIDEAGRTGATTRLSGMISRYHLHGLRLPTVQGAQPIVTPDALGMWVTKDPTSGKLSLPPTAGLYALTGQQFPLPPITAGPFAIQVGGTAPWLAFKNGTQTIAATVSAANPPPPGEIAAAPIEALRALVTAPAYRFVSGYAELGAQGQLVRTPATYGLGTYASWIAAAVPQLPYGTAAAGAVPRIWSFPTALSSIVDQSVPSIEPRFTLSTQTYDEASRKTVSSPISNYGFASKVSFTIKRVPAVDQATASAQTYEVVGAGATDIVLLEEIVARFTSDASIEGLWLTFAPDPSLPAGGLQSGSASVAFGIGQGNLSTVTRPPGGGALAMALRGAAVASGPVALNGNAMFMRLLWEASITAQGGFYLYYDDAGTALPDHLFNKDGEAVLTALVVYGANLDNRLAACMNAAVVTDPFDPTKSALVAVAAPIAASYAFAATTQTLAQFADFYFADIADLFDTSDPKNQNATVALLANAPIAVNAGTYMVSPLGTQPGGDPSAIAAWFGTDVASLGAANPRLMPFPTTFAPFTALRLPPLTVAAGKTMNGTALSSLGAIASYFGADIVGLAVDNQTLPGLFTAKLYVAGGPVTRSSRLPMGSQLLELTRPVPPPVPPSTDPSYAANLMLNQFSMLGYAIGKNQDFDPSNLGVPVGPTGGGGTGRGKLRVPNALAAGDTWTYSVTLGYGSSMAGVPANPNPYYAVGRLLQVDFDWLDVYGNTIISDLSTPAAGDTGGLNGAPLLLGYTDALVGLGQWPSASAKWSITGPAGVPQLELHFSFDVTRYTGSDPKTNVANAQADALVYARLATQLADPARMSNPNAIAFSVATTLTTAPLPVAGTNLDGLTAWLTAIGAYLSAVAGGGSGTAPADTPLTFPMPTSALVSAQLFELTCSFTLARTAGVVEGEFETVPGIRSSTTQLAPDGAATATGLAAFATNFETAFTLSDSMLKVAAGPDRYQGGAATSSTLWALRIGLAPAQGIGYKIHEKKPPLIFAPKPISNQLVSEPAPIYAYTTNTGIDFGAPNPPALSFANVDLDVWTRRIFAAVDDLLSPEFISALVILDEKIYGKAPSPTTMTNLRALTENKKALASMYAQQLEAVFIDQSGADATTVAAAFAQSMLEQLGNAYQTQAALQYSADVVAAIVEPPPTTLMPNLYGPVLQSGTPVPGIAFTATKIPLATANDVPLAFLVTTPSRTSGDTEASNIPVSLVYSPTNVEHQRASLPQIPGDYIASSWLQFVLPPPADPTDPHSIARSLGTVDIPMVLRSYPSNPALASQQGTQMYQGQLPPSAITQATQWTYGFTYSLPAYYPQDTVYATVVFNIMAPPPMMLASFADVFGWLAEFVTVYPDVERDLDAALRTLTPASTGAQVQTANVAIQSVNAMLGKITGVSHVDAKEHRRQSRLAIRPRSHGLIGATDPPWQFTLTEAQYGQLKPQPPAPLPADALVITVTSLAGPVPVVQLAGYKTNDAAVTPVPGATTVQYYFTQGTGTTVLAFDDAQTLRRTVQYPTLQILDKQDAQVNVHVTRNEKLVNTRVTNPDFVYRTADVTFQAPCLPSILYTGALDISQIAPSKPPAPRSLQAHLTALFTTLVSGASQSAMSLALSVGYQYTVNPSPTGVALPVTVPILMQPPLRVYWGTGTTPPGDVKLTDMIADVASAIATWFSTTQPSSVNGTLLFSLTVMASLTQTTMPLLRLTDLQLEIDDIAPPLIPPTPHLHAADRAGEA